MLLKGFFPVGRYNSGSGNKWLTLSRTSLCFYVPFENTVGKWEIARNDNSVPAVFSNRFQTLSVWKSLNIVVWERINSFPDDKL